MDTVRGNKFATAINRINGRVQVPVARLIMEDHDVDHVDMITLPGPDKVLSEYEDLSEI